MTLVNEGFEPGCPPEILRAEKFRRTTCRRCRRGRDSGAGFRRRPSRSRNRPVRDREDMELTLNENNEKNSRTICATTPSKKVLVKMLEFEHSQ